MIPVMIQFLDGTCSQIKKALTFHAEGFIASIGASLEEFAEDVRAIFDIKLKNL